MDQYLHNIFMLCLAFSFIFTSFQTTAGLQKVILKSMMDDDPNFNASSFTSLIIFYVVYAVSQWIVPSLIAICGPRFAMLIGALSYAVFIIQYIYPISIVLYIVNFALGAGAAVLWNAQGTYIARCSTIATATQYCGIFLTMQHASYLIGALITYYVFNQKTYIDTSERMTVVGALLLVMGIGIGALGLIRKVESNESPDLQPTFSISAFVYTAKALVKLFITKEMLMLEFIFIYTGLVHSFTSGVLSTAVARTLWIADEPYETAAIAGLVKGGAGVVGSLIFALFGGYTTKWGRDPMMFLSCFMHILAYILMYLNIPNDASNDETEDVSLFDPPSEWVAILCAAIFGGFNAIVIVHIYSMMAGTFVENATGAFAIFKMTQSIACGLSFLYSAYVSVYAQMGILIFFAVMGAMGFFLVEYMAKHGDLGPEYPEIHGFGATNSEVPH